MSNKTPNIQLPLYDNADGEMYFKDFWSSICFNNDGTIKEFSAFQKIDSKFGTVDQNVSKNTTDISNILLNIQSMQQTIASMPQDIKDDVAKMIDDTVDKEY